MSRDTMVSAKIQADGGVYRRTSPGASTAGR
jgi:hypothetical protein